MSITTIDQLVAGFQAGRFFNKALGGAMVSGRPMSYWPITGIPSSGSTDGSTTGTNLTSSTAGVNGQIPFNNPTSSQTTYLARFTANCTAIATIVLADRLWQWGVPSITSTSAQNVTTAAFPSRDQNSSTGGAGVLLGCEVSATTGANTPTITVSYSNTVPTSGQSGTNIKATVATSITGTFHPISLAAGDTGVSAVASLTLSASWTSGSISLVAYRVIASVTTNQAGSSGFVDPVTGGLPVMPLGCVPFIFIIPGATTSSGLAGQVIYATG